ncbi:MAG: SAM-dependent chlorinase/fluorinase, partial [Cyanobacteria bacterium P01_H01_bin.130]
MAIDRQSLIAMVSDFGAIDNYVGVMKGVIFNLFSGGQIADITHQIPPQNVRAAQFALATAVDYFPVGTVFLAVVDPGVGTTRRAIALRTERYQFIGPDNGLFSTVLQRHRAIAAVQLDNPIYWRSPDPSATFHGRDIFAPAAAHLAAGVPLENLGTAIAPETLTQLTPPTPTPMDQGGWLGEIQYVDRFGNLVTTFPGDWVGDRPWAIDLDIPERKSIAGGQTYGDTEPGALIALVG